MHRHAIGKTEADKLCISVCEKSTEREPDSASSAEQLSVHMSNAV